MKFGVLETDTKYDVDMIIIVPYVDTKIRRTIRKEFTGYKIGHLIVEPQVNFSEISKYFFILFLFYFS